MAEEPGNRAHQLDAQHIVEPAQFAALAHPLRQRLLFALGHRPSTISRLAVQLEAAKGSVAHHLKVLRDAGLVQVAETRQVRGGTEVYYRRSARRLIVPDPRPEGTAAMLTAVAQELGRSPDETALSLRHLRLRPEAARELAETLTRLVDEAQDDEGEQDGPEPPSYGVLVTVYQLAGEQAQPD
ncbi:Helix-turn-helix domain-containing protein [Streptomyces sp. DvalAA-14]|uniref:ArsR/SmtB family transcription factor n=1 Tax=unclassified Streptomyces TaxID=2593676 RepID=UPI00081AF037|nr:MULTISPECIES: ArsR family transcriptional regulator [unclassified Streptomyces]MYS22373.1 helix-turn-helix domain-containing protein [Streptomyces sp. SID4948]SCE14760.1 Helix-turn-helix domain-containing protein [Streptomyces sp. DvalAA-14]